MHDSLGSNPNSMEQRLIALLQSSLLHPSQLNQVHARVITAHSSLAPLFHRVISNSSNILLHGRKVFDRYPRPDPFLANAMVSTYSKLSMHQDVLETFSLAHRKGAQILVFSFPVVLKSCATLAVPNEGKQVHCLVLALGFCTNVYIQTGLIDFYAKNNDLDSAKMVLDEIVVKDPVPINCLISGYSKAGKVRAARELFDEMTHRTVSSWNSMISCYAHEGEPLEGLRLFEWMLTDKMLPNEMTLVIVLSVCAKLGELRTGLRVKKMVDDLDLSKNMIVRTALLEMYVKCGAVDEARVEFDQMGQKDVVAWSAMVTGYAQNGRSNEALELFEGMRMAKCEPNDVTLVSVLSACAQLGSTEVGERIGNYIESQGFGRGVYVGSALLDMYAKCGNIKRARRVFEEMHQRDTVSWNSMIGGLALNGFALDAIDLYEMMKKTKFKPDDITFVGLLTACTHAGLIDLGLNFFGNMKAKHGIVPKVEHCACIVDLFCRSGRLEDAYEFICKMEVEPNAAIWGTLLSACRVYSNVELAERSAEELLVLEPENSSNYVLLASIYADAGRWEDARRVRHLMNHQNVQKLAGYSWIELDNMIHKFLVQDTSHPRSDEVYSAVDGLGFQLKQESHPLDFDLDYDV